MGTGQMLLLKDQVLRCSSIAVSKVMQTTELIVKALDNDKEARKKGEKHGFAELVSSDKVTANRRDESVIEVKEEEEVLSEEEMLRQVEAIDEDMDEKPNVEILAKGVGAIGGGGANKWLDYKETTKFSASQSQHTKLKRSHTGDIAESGIKQEVNDSDSEEETQTMLLQSCDH